MFLIMLKNIKVMLFVAFVTYFLHCKILAPHLFVGSLLQNIDTAIIIDYDAGIPNI